MINYKIRPWFEQENKTFLRRITLPVRRWWMTPEGENSISSWILVVLTASAIIGVIIANIINERLAALLALDGGWIPVAIFVFFTILFTGFAMHMIKLYSRLWIHIHNVTDGYNDEGTANDYTLKIIDTARDWLLLYDYGEDNAGNIYNDKKVEAALLAKLQDKGSKFELSMIFKKDQEAVDKLALIKALKQWQREHPESLNKVYFTYQVARSDVRYRGFNSYCGDYPDHYKLNDLGYAYLTQHAEGQIRREFSYAAPLAYAGMKERIQDCLDFHKAAAAVSS